MTISLRLVAAAALLTAPLAASAAPGDGSDLDRMSDTGSILGRAAASAPASAARDCGGGVTVPDGTACPAPGPPPDSNPVPLDGGLSLLALAGAGLAAQRLRKRRRSA